MFNYKLLFSFASLVFALIVNAQSKWSAPASYKSIQNPFALTEQQLTSGMKLFKQYCIACHGATGKGNGSAAAALNPKPADFSKPEIVNQSSGEFFYKIANGRGAMPAWKNTLSKQQLWSLVVYVQSLNPNPNTVNQTKINSQTVNTVNANVPSNNDSIVSVKYKPSLDSALVMREINRLKSNTDSLFIVTAGLHQLIDSLNSANDNLKSEIDAQKKGDRKFLATGSANFYFKIDPDPAYWEDNSMGGGWLPLFLWQPHKKLMVESHLHIEFGGHAEETGGHAHGAAAESAISFPEISISYAALNWMLFKNSTLVSGYFLSPFGIFNERLHPEWINKFYDTPFGMGHENSLFPQSELGVQLRGTVPLKKVRNNYSIYICNGPQLDTTIETGGKLLYSSVSDNNSGKAIGGRIGVLPIYKSNFELGFSAQYGRVGPDKTLYRNVNAILAAGDLSYNKNCTKLKGSINFKAQYNFASVGRATYQGIFEHKVTPSFFHGNEDTLNYSFDNTFSSYFIMLSYRPENIQNKFFSKLEYCLRYDEYNLPEQAVWFDSDKRISLGINYWINTNSSIKFSYQQSEYSSYLVTQLVVAY